MNTPARHITWFIPAVKKSSGGLRTVLAHAKALEEKGFSTTLQVDEREEDAEKARARIDEYYGYAFADVQRGWQNAAKCDLAIATVWSSALPVASLPFETKRLYYVQDFEPWFYPMGAMYLAAEASYTLGLPAVTIGRFLARKLAREYKISTAYHDFGANPAIYRPLDDIKKEDPSICFLFQPGKERRAAELGLAALEIVAAMRPEVPIYLFGTPPAKGLEFKKPFVFLGSLGLEECNTLYNRCSVGLCLSCTNPSRVPFEMMASGLPVVELLRENTIYDFPQDAMLLTRQSPKDIAMALLTLLDNPGKREEMQKAGMSFMRQRPEKMESKAFAGIIRSWFETGVFPAARGIPPTYNKTRH